MRTFYVVVFVVGFVAAMTYLPIAIHMFVRFGQEKDARFLCHGIITLFYCLCGLAFVVVYPVLLFEDNVKRWGIIDNLIAIGIVSLAEGIYLKGRKDGFANGTKKIYVGLPFALVSLVGLFLVILVG